MKTGFGLLSVPWFLLGLLATSTMPQTLTRQQQLDLLEQANHAFEQALASREPQKVQGFYRRATTAYEQLIAAGIDNAKLHYNLGNGYFRMDDLGRAIVHYRLGLRLEPGNRRLRANLRYARSRRIDQFDTSTEGALLPALLFWHDDLSLQTQFSLALTAFLLAWACAFAHLFRRRISLRWLWAGAVLVCVLFMTSALRVQAQHANMHRGVIVARETLVRKGNGESYALQFPQPLHPGAEFTVLETRGSWLQVRLENGARGWLRRAHAVLW